MLVANFPLASKYHLIIEDIVSSGPSLSGLDILVLQEWIVSEWHGTNPTKRASRVVATLYLPRMSVQTTLDKGQEIQPTDACAPSYVDCFHRFTFVNVSSMRLPLAKECLSLSFPRLPREVEDEQ